MNDDDKSELEARIRQDVKTLYEIGTRDFGLSKDEVSIILFETYNKEGLEICSADALAEYKRRIKAKGSF